MSKNLEGMVSFFDMFEDNKDIQEFNKEQEKTKPETKVEVKNEGDKGNITKTNSDTKKLEKSVQAVDPNKKLEKDCTKCEKIVVKVFGIEAFTLEEEEEIKSIKIDNMLARLIANGFDEFTTIKAKWSLSLSDDKKIGYLIPVYADLYAKG